MKILVTGARSGLGKYISEKLNCIILTRDTPLSSIKNQSYDLIVHCAFNTRNNPCKNELKEYIEDNILLTKKLLDTTYSHRFIFISSIDVYPNCCIKNENIEIDINEVPTIYGQCKLICEDYIRRHPNYLILRCGGIIGPYKLPRSIIDILRIGETNLSKDSQFSYVHQQIILDIINTPDIKNEIINVVSDTSMRITEMEELKNPITYGNHTYKATRVMSGKLKNLCPNIKIPSSKETLFDVLKNM